MVRGTVEETLNAMLDAEADQLTRAAAVLERGKLQGKVDLAKAKVLKRTPEV